MSVQIAPVRRIAPPDLWLTGGSLVSFGHHRRKRPDDHRCVCGRLRDECVRVAVRALWSV
ncbi:MULTISPECIES: hypothetical protein [Catenuloplanes]|uniref:Uncharacterized protein n=1 Tax=Catenuloplanes niger TaxID=587534 RepID=A0AAE3ZRI6_9ACTN|nr:hypothetical protein [Catenuloplanes niger]MDR7324754.1 hypothetical protein [Catenuloplanes niger]